MIRMGLFDSKYQVMQKGGFLKSDKVVLDNVSKKEAEKFIDSKSGFFGGDGNDYFIKKR